MAHEGADESGFPRQIGASLGKPGAGVLVGRKRTRSEKADEGDLVILPVDHDDVLLVSSPPVLRALERIEAALKENTKAIQALSRR